jgi:hypothetical protein
MRKEVVTDRFVSAGEGFNGSTPPDLLSRRVIKGGTTARVARTSHEIHTAGDLESPFSRDFYLCTSSDEDTRRAT